MKVQSLRRMRKESCCVFICYYFVVVLNGRRIFEAYVGEHGAGKSEVALSRALWLAREGKEVALADLDTVEPCYTLNSPLTKALKNIANLTLLTNVSERVFPGETGNVISPVVRFALIQRENAILDIGYGVDGFKVLNLLEGYSKFENEVQVYLVQNFSRPATGTIEDAFSYLKTFRKLDGLINNSHLGDATTIDVAISGEEQTFELSARSGVPVIASTLWWGALSRGALRTEPISSPEEVEAEVESSVGEIEMDQEKIGSDLREKFRAPLWIITRLMPIGFWG